jgi:pilus assembly protein FimV
MIQRLVSILLLFCISASVHSLGLGDIELSSGLNQPFNARIELLSPTPAEIDSLTVRLADSEAFSRAGVDRLFILTSLRFEIQVNEIGPDYILITTREAIREPYLNFLVEASWSSGRLFREYTVLLDPPLYDPNTRRVTTPPSSQSEPVQGITRQPVRTTAPASPITPSRPTPSTLAPPASTQTTPQPRIFTPSFTGDEYGPVAARTTLWSLANQIRPDSSVTTQQMMLALLRANPEAFINNNINGLREGAILRIPGRNEILSVSAESAFIEAVSQNSMWEEMRRSFAGSAGQRPLGSDSQPASGVAPTALATSDSELRLVSPGVITGEGQSGASFDSGGQSGANLALANEQLEVISSENEDLRGQIEESEDLIGDLQRLIELKDDELATMQDQMAGAEIQDGEIDLGDESIPQTDITSGQIDLGADNTIPETPQIEEAPEPVATVEDTPETSLPPAVTTVQTDTVPAAGGMVDQILAVVIENIRLVGGAVGALLVAFFGLFYIKKRKARAETEFEEIVAGEFADLDEHEELTDVPESVEEQQDVEDIPEWTEEQTLDAIPEPESETATGFPIDDDMPASTAETSFLAAEETEEEDEQESEEDPLAEVNVFLAYEHFDQAENFVRDVIKRSPNNLDFHSKLLEVFYSSGDKPKYEEEARVLQELTNGEGPHWEMALIMWQEISPNRDLFSDSTGSVLDDSASSQSGGIVDLTSSDSVISDDEDGIDFDLGTDDPNDKKQDVLDLTSTNTNIMDITMDGDDALEDSKPKEDILDLTMAEGFESNEPFDTDGSENLLDMSTGLDNSDEDILDITATPGVQPDLDHDERENKEVDIAIDNDDVLDITSGNFGTNSISDDDDVLDITSGNFDRGSPSDDSSLDIDSEGLNIESSTEADNELSSSDSSVLDFDSSSSDSDEDLNLSLDVDEDESDGAALSFDDVGSDASDGLSLDLDSADDDASGGLSLDLDSADDDASDGLSLDLDSADDDASDGLSLDLDSADDDSDGLSLEIDSEVEDSGSDMPEINMDDTIELPRKPTALDMETTVELPKEETEIHDGSDEDDDTTVIIPKAPGVGEQTDEDEVATKLDLAKAYVELGDNDSAQTILDEILAEGSEAQIKQAEALKSQIS